MKDNQYADYSAGDAFIAGHFGEWVCFHKKEMTKSQLAHIAVILEQFVFETYEGTGDPDRIATHFNLIFEDINKRIIEKEK